MKSSLRGLKKICAAMLASFVAFTALPFMPVEVPETTVSAADYGSYIPAFPGAEGGGMFATGGRGGTVYHVTNLNDSGTGSFRDAVSSSNRIVVFDVSGTIELKSDVVIKDNITVAGQTAPGGKGITLKNYKVGLGGDNIILRFISSRPGERGTSADYDAFGGAKGSNSIVDHCSIGWANDEQWGLYSNNMNQTVQWTIVGPSNSFSYHSKGIHGFGVMFGKGQNSWHHNLIPHNVSRNFRGKVVGTNVMDFVNNVVYDWGYQTAYGTMGHINFAGNYYKAGSSTSGGYNYLSLTSGSNVENYKFYLNGNKMLKSDGTVYNNESNNWSLVNYGSVTSTYGYDEAYYRTDSYMPLYVNGYDVSVVQNMDTADVAFDKVTKYVGAGISETCKPKIDLEVAYEAKTGTGSITGARPLSEASESQQAEIEKNNINFVDYSGYYPSAILTKEITDSDNDGMPDEWELARGLDPEDASDATDDYLGEGYNNIEYYINDLTVNAFPAGTVTLSKETANSDYTYSTWKSSANVKANTELMDGLYPKGDLTYYASASTIDKVKFDGYVKGISSSTPLVFEPSYNGDYTVYYTLGASKTFQIVDEDGNIVATNSNNTSSAFTAATTAAVTAGKTYYAYVAGSNAYFHGARFTRLKTATAVNNYSEYKFDLSSSKGSNTYVTDNTGKAKIKMLSGFNYHSMGGYNAVPGDIMAITLGGSGKYTNTKLSFDLLYPAKATAKAEVFAADDTSYSKSLGAVSFTADGTNPVSLSFDGEGGKTYIVRVTSDSASYFLAKALTVKTKAALVEETVASTPTPEPTKAPVEYTFDLTSDKGRNVEIADTTGNATFKALSNFKYHSMGGYNGTPGDIMSITLDGNETYKNTSIAFTFLRPNNATATAAVYNSNDLTTALDTVSAKADGTNPVTLTFDAVGGNTYVVKITSDSASYFLATNVKVTTQGDLIAAPVPTAAPTAEPTPAPTAAPTAEPTATPIPVVEYTFDLTSDKGRNVEIADTTGNATFMCLSSFRYHSMGGYNGTPGDIMSITLDGNETHKNTSIAFTFLRPNNASATAAVYNSNDLTTALDTVTAQKDGTNPVTLTFDAVGGNTYVVKITSDSASYFLATNVKVTTSGKLIAAPVPTAAPTAEPTAEPTAAPTAAPTAEPTEAPTAEPTMAPTEVPAATPVPGVSYSFDLSSNRGSNTYIKDGTAKASVKLLSGFNYHSMGGYNAVPGEMLALTFGGTETYAGASVALNLKYPTYANGTIAVYNSKDMVNAIATVSATGDGTNPLVITFDAVGGNTYIVKTISDTANYILAPSMVIKTSGTLVENAETTATAAPTVTEAPAATQAPAATETPDNSNTGSTSGVSVNIVPDVIYVAPGGTVSFDTIVNSADGAYYCEISGGNWWFEPVDEFVNVWYSAKKTLTNKTNTFTISQWCGLADGYEMTLTAYALDTSEGVKSDTVKIIVQK